MTGLAARFAALARRLGATADPGPLAGELLAAWAEPSRVYHGTDHLRDCLAQLDGEAAPGPGADLAEAALWFHDAVYDARASDNESRSAAWAESALQGLGVPAPVPAEVARLVRLTAHAGPPRDPLGALVCDVDLSILGRAPPEFDEYERRIRAEYAWMPEPAFRQGRRRVLEALLARRPLFGTSRFRTRYEAAARANLERALRGLNAPDG